MQFPDYVGPQAFGLKMGVVLPGMPIVDLVYDKLAQCHADGLLSDGDIVCITESVVARAQNNYVSIDDIIKDVREKLQLPSPGRVAVLFPIASRNRFSMILKGIAGAVAGGEVIVQLSFPCDEVGNQFICPEFAGSLSQEVITPEDIDGQPFEHPITGVNYIDLYLNIIKEAGAKPSLFLCNNPLELLRHRPDGIIVADIHTRKRTKTILTGQFKNCLTLDELCNNGAVCSEWGLLGSNMSSAGRLKLAPKNGQEIVEELQRRLAAGLGVKVEVIIYGDGAYRDPTSGIYELADPKPAFAATEGVNRFREGIKYKYLADRYHQQGKSAAEIERLLEESKQQILPRDSIEKEGTTPRRMEDILASLADLVSGSADAGTPVVLIKGF